MVCNLSSALVIRKIINIKGVTVLLFAGLINYEQIIPWAILGSSLSLRVWRDGIHFVSQFAHFSERLEEVRDPLSRRKRESEKRWKEKARVLQSFGEHFGHGLARLSQRLNLNQAN